MQSNPAGRSGGRWMMCDDETSDDPSDPKTPAGEEPGEEPTVRGSSPAHPRDEGAANAASHRDASPNPGQDSVHVPVLATEVLASLALEPGMVVVDGTTGGAGHGVAIAHALGSAGRYVGLDRDAEILPFARASLAGAPRGVEVSLHHLRFSQMEKALESLGLTSCDRVLLDLGVSSLQLDSPHRGFSFMEDGPLDMRMDQGSKALTAAQWLQGISVEELGQVLADYGGERHARRVARRLIEWRDGGDVAGLGSNAHEPVPRGKSARRRARQRDLGRTSEPFYQTTGQLADAVVRALPPPARRRGRIHPATRSFQAIRFAVNEEGRELDEGLQAAARVLNPTGRLAVITFMSLDDRVVKRFTRDQMRPLNKKPIEATEAEVAVNPRSRSAKLRVAEPKPPSAPGLDLPGMVR